MDIELFRAMVHKTNYYFVYMALGALGSFSSRVSMHVSSAYCEGMSVKLHK